MYYKFDRTSKIIVQQNTTVIMKLDGRFLFFIKEIKESTREVQLAEIFGNEFMKSRNQ